MPDAMGTRNEPAEETMIGAEGAARSVPAAHRRGAGLGGLTIAATGIVFGDIGISPLYAVDQIFFGHGGVTPTEANVLGGISLIIWTLTVIVAIKYAVLVLRRIRSLKREPVEANDGRRTGRCTRGRRCSADRPSTRPTNC
jgi:uncharacterized membrane protein